MHRNILALVTEAFGGHGGIAQYNRDFLTAIAGNARQIEVLPRNAPAPMTDLPIGVVQHPPQFKRLAYSAAALSIARRIRPSLVFCGHLYQTPLAATIAKWTGARLAVQLHGLEIWQRPSLSCRVSLKAADIVLCVSRHTQERLLHWTNIKPERTSVLHNTVRPDFSPGDRDAARARFALGEAPVLLSVSRLDSRERYKGHDRVVDALVKLRDKWPGLIYLIAGQGDDRLRLQAHATAAGVRNQVRFLGEVPNEILPDLYRAADLFVLPSTGEGFGIVFVEAMACGTPALGLAVGGASDALADGNLGIALAPDADLAPAIDAALTKPIRDPETLAAQVQRRFGPIPFANRANALLDSLK